MPSCAQRSNLHCHSMNDLVGLIRELCAQGPPPSQQNSDMTFVGREHWQFISPHLHCEGWAKEQLLRSLTDRNFGTGLAFEGSQCVRQLGSSLGLTAATRYSRHFAVPKHRHFSLSLYGQVVQFYAMHLLKSLQTIVCNPKPNIFPFASPRNVHLLNLLSIPHKTHWLRHQEDTHLQRIHQPWSFLGH